MNTKQTNAAKRLQNALQACHKAGLKGGVYDGSFYLWPTNATPDPRDAPNFGFFYAVQECGGNSITTEMNLDGGAGA